MCFLRDLTKYIRVVQDPFEYLSVDQRSGLFNSLLFRALVKCLCVVQRLGYLVKCFCMLQSD